MTLSEPKWVYDVGRDAKGVFLAIQIRGLKATKSIIRLNATQERKLVESLNYLRGQAEREGVAAK